MRATTTQTRSKDDFETLFCSQMVYLIAVDLGLVPGERVLKDFISPTQLYTELVESGAFEEIEPSQNIDRKVDGREADQAISRLHFHSDRLLLTLQDTLRRVEEMRMSLRTMVGLPTSSALPLSTKPNDRAEFEAAMRDLMDWWSKLERQRDSKSLHELTFCPRAFFTGEPWIISF